MSDLLLTSMIDMGLPAKSLTMEEVVNVNTPVTNATRGEPIYVKFMVKGEQSLVRTSLSTMKSMMSKGVLHRKMIMYDEHWYDVGQICGIEELGENGIARRFVDRCE